MDGRHPTRLVLLAALMVATTIAIAQQQNQNNQQNQNQPAQQQPKKKSLWQKAKDVQGALQGQNANQTTPPQQGVQQTGQQVQGGAQNGVQQVQNGAQQVQGAAQQANPTQQGQQGGEAFSGGAGAGACGASCFDAGPFQANVSQMTMSQQGGWHVIRMNIQFHNTTNQPLIIAYHDGSMVMVDNNGNTYVPAGGNPGALQGMGIDRGTQTDSQFVLGPGQTGNAMFSVARGRGNNSPVGTGYTYNLTLDELQAQNGAMAIPVRQYNLNFPTLSPGTNNAAAFSSGSTPANGSVARGVAPQGKGQSVGQSVGGTPRTNAQRTATAVPGQRPAATPAQQRTALPVQQRPAGSVVQNAAIKTPVATQTATKPTAAKTTATAAPKKVPATTATTTQK